MSTVPNHLPDVSLAELTERAAMLTRVDRKYVLSRREAEAVVTLLPAGTRVLEIDGLRTMGYASTYFDTTARDSYLTAATRRRRRWKVRTRSYLDTGTSWLEVKTRGARGTTVKVRTAHEGPADELSAEDVTFVEDSLRRAGIQVTEDGWRAAPVLRTRYDRTTLALPDGASRATVDSALSWQGTDGTVLERPDLVVVETKTGSTPSPLDRTLWGQGHRPARISKFATGMALLDPSLPAHPWHRLLKEDGPLAA